MRQGGNIITSGTGFLGAVYELDAGLIASAPAYTSQTWYNLTAAPNDGSAQSAYDFQLGATQSAEASDPVLQGAPGDTSVSTYYEGSGNQYMRLQGANTTFIDSLHKNNARFTWYGFVRTGITSSLLFGTQPTATTSIGISLRLNGSYNLEFIQGDGTTANTIFTSSTIPFSPSTLFFLGFSYDENTGDGLIYYNGPSRVTQAFNSTYSSPSALATTGYPIFLATATTNGTNTGVRTYRTGLSNLALTATLFDSVYSQYKSRIGH